MLVAWLMPSLLYGQQEDSCSSLSGALPFEIVRCKTEQRKRKIDSLNIVTRKLRDYSLSVADTGLHIHAQIQQSDSIWKLHIDADCFLQADAAYPGESGGGGRANDQEKGYAISECLDHFVSERLEYLAELSKSIYMIPVRNEGNKADSKGKTLQTKKKRSKSKAETGHRPVKAAPKTSQPSSIRLCGVLDPGNPKCDLSNTRLQTWNSFDVVSTEIDDGAAILGGTGESLTVLWAHEKASIGSDVKICDLSGSGTRIWAFPVRIQIPGAEAWGADEIIVRAHGDSIGVLLRLPDSISRKCRPVLETR